MGLGGIRKGQMRNPSQEMHTRRRCTPGKNCVTCSAKFLHLAKGTEIFLELNTLHSATPLAALCSDYVYFRVN